jgi:hypothetical protein
MVPLDSRIRRLFVPHCFPGAQHMVGALGEDMNQTLIS